jgi:hypothetical protein
MAARAKCILWLFLWHGCTTVNGMDAMVRSDEEEEGDGFKDGIED